MDRIFLWVLPVAWLVEVPTKWLPPIVWPWRWVAGVVAMRLVLHGSVYVADSGAGTVAAWSTWQALQHPGGLSLVVVLVWWITYALLGYQPRFNSGYVLALACLASAVATLLGGYLSCAMHLVVLASVAWAIGWVRVPPTKEAGGPYAEGVVWLLWLSLLTSARYFADLPAYASVFLVAAPTAAGLGALPWHRLRLSWASLAATYLGPIVVLTAVIVSFYLSIRTASSPASPPPGATIHDYLQFGK